MNSSMFDPMQGLAGTTAQINTNTIQNKADALSNKVQNKIAVLAGNPSIQAKTDDAHQYTASQRPDLINYKTPAEIQEELGTAATYQVLTRDDGSKYSFRHNADGTYAHDTKGNWIEDTYTGKMRNAYIDDTAQGNMKFGLAKSDVLPGYTPFEARYMDKTHENPYKNYDYKEDGQVVYNPDNSRKVGYNGTPGPMGVTPENGALMDITLPYNVATQLEYDIHSNAGQLASRAMGQGGKTEETNKLFGAGQTEYTTPDAPLWNVNYDMKNAKIASDTVLPHEVTTTVSSTVNQPQQKRYTANELNTLLGLGNELPSNNIARGVGAATLDVGAKAGSLIGRGVEAIGQVTGSETASGVGKAIQDAYTKFQTKQMGKEMTGYDDRNAQALQQEIGDTIKKDGYIAALGKAITDSRSLEVLATSVPEMVALAASVGGMAIANANNDINIGQANLGREYTPEEKAMATVASVVGTYLDRAGDKLALSGMNSAKLALKGAIEKAPVGVQEALASKYGKGLLAIGEAPLKLAGAAGVEGGTEWAQTLTQNAAQNPEVFNSGLTSKDYEEAGVAGVLGAAMGTHMAVPAVAKDMVTGSKWLSPEQVDVVSKPEEEPVSKPVVSDAFYQKVQAAKNGELSEERYRNRTELKNVAMEFLGGNDSAGILASDDDVHTKLDKVKELVSLAAEDGELTPEHKEQVASKLKDIGIDSSYAMDSINEAESTGNAIRDLKSAKDVDAEVVSGPRGFLTYYNDATSALQNGDQGTFEANVRKLGDFISSQETKRGRLAEAEREIEAEYSDRVKMAMEADGISRADAMKKVHKQWVSDKEAGRGYVSVAYSDSQDARPFKLFKSQVVENSIAKANDKEYTGGGYAAIRDIDKSIEAMTHLYYQLTGNATVSNGLPETTREWIDSKLGSGTTVEELKKTVSGNSKLTSKQKAAINEYVSDKEPVVEPKVEDANVSYEEPTSDYVSQEEVNSVFADEPTSGVPVDEPSGTSDEPVSSAPVDEPSNVSEEPKSSSPADEPGVSVSRTKKEPMTVGKDAKLASKLSGEVEKLNRRLEKASLDGDREETSKVKGLIERAKPLIDMKIAQSPVSRVLANRVKLMDASASANMVSKTFHVGKLTPLNAEPVKAEANVMEAIEASIPRDYVTVKNGKEVVTPLVVKVRDANNAVIPGRVKLNENMALDDPARAVLFNGDGSVNGNVATAIWKAMNDYVATSASALGRPADMDKLEEMFPHLFASNEPDAVDRVMDVAVMMGQGGELLKFEAEGIGSDIMKLLGIEAADKKVVDRDIQAMKTSFGMMAIHMAEDMGLVKVTKLDLGSEGTVPVLQLGDKYKENKDAVLDEADKYSSYDVPDVPKKNYSFVPVERNNVKVHNQPYTDVTPLQKEMKQTLDNLEFQVNSGVDELVDMFGNDPEVLKDVLGRKSEAELSEMSYDGKKAAESVNREIETKVDGFFRMLDDAKEGDGYRSLFFEWFVTKGGRTNSYSTVVDPQSDKQLARWLVTAAGSRTEVTKGDISDNSPVGVGFKYGIAQAFDVDVDKLSKDKVLAKADELLAMNPEELKAMVSKSSHIGHALLALANVKKYQASEGSFVSDMVMEMDGLTNGLAFRLVQFPMNDTMKLLPKVGVVMESDPMWEAGTIAAVKDSDKKYGEFHDLYETVGIKLQGAKVKLGEKEVAIKEILKDVLPDLSVLKEARAMAKSPVMVTGYSAGETSTKLAIVNEQVSALIEKIVSGDLSDEAISKLEKITGSRNLVKDLKEMSIKDRRMSNFRGAMTKFYMDAYAEPMYKALMETIGGLKAVGDLVTSAYDYMYKVLEKEYEVSKRGLLGQEEKVELMRKLLTKVGPIVRNSETVGDLDRVLALSRKLVDIADEAKKAGVKGNYGTSVNSRGKNGTDTVQLIARGFGEPGAAGGVLQTHTEDNHTMARAMRGAKDKFNQVFDAMVLGAGQWDVVTGYNKEFYELNKEFSMLNAVIEAVSRNVNSGSSKGISLKIGKETVDGNGLLSRLNGVKAEVDANRAKIFGSRLKVGQMVGTDGTMHVVEVVNEASRIEDMKKAMKEALMEFTKETSGSINKSLSDTVKRMECK